jgi:squalene-hopene/tetraprenyl-beta-curcumene cyclase
MTICAVEIDRLTAAWRTARQELLAQRTTAGHWVGELASSPLSTATAISALVLSHRGSYQLAGDSTVGDIDEPVQRELSDLIIPSLHWLARHQNDDGGWGDTDRSRSNIATTMLVRAVFQLTGIPAQYDHLAEQADAFIKHNGGVTALKRRYGKDKSFAVPILTNLALAGLVPWKQVSALPFEWACVPQRWYQFVRLPVVSYAIPALVAIGQAKFFHDPPRNPVMRFLRSACLKKSQAVLEKMQPESGGYLEAIPLTSFVVMSMASSGQTKSRVVQRGVQFLLNSVRSDGSWPIDSNLATWNTTLAVNALVPDQVSAAGSPDGQVLTDALLQWLLDAQHTEQHPFTGARPGGWAWTDLSGGVPDADDTAGALLALSRWQQSGLGNNDAAVRQAAEDGVKWLINLQNRNGGWPTFCRGWGHLPFDRSSCDITAHVVRALITWRLYWQTHKPRYFEPACIERAVHRGMKFLKKQQRPDGSWIPLWFGNQFHEAEENPVYGTSKVLLMLNDLKLLNSSMAQRATRWLVDAQLADGGWGPAISRDSEARWTRKPSKNNRVFLRKQLDDGKHSDDAGCKSSVEETALAVEALLNLSPATAEVRSVIDEGVAWLVRAVESGCLNDPVPIGFYFAKLWYYERLYPRLFAAGALARAACCWAEATAPTPFPMKTLP